MQGALILDGFHPPIVRTVRLLSATLLVFSCIASAPAGEAAAGAEEAPIELATLEITAHPTGADERTAAVWVMRPATTETPTAIGELLNQIPGVHLDRAGGAGGRSTLYLRGGEENHTLVLLDSVPLNDPTNSRGGGVDFSLIDPSAIDSAALVRGPASMRHGPEAISGVLHLDTSAHPVPGHGAAIEGGGGGLGRAAFRSVFAAGHDGATATLGGTWHTEEAADDAGGLDRVFLHGGYQSTGTLDVAIRAWHLDQESRAFPDDSGGVRYAEIRELEQRDDQQSAASIHLGRRDDEGSWLFTADAARLDATTVSPGVAPGERDPAGLPASVDDIRLERYRAGVVLERRVGEWTMSGGLDAAREDGTDDALLDFGFFQLPAGFSMVRDRFGGFIEGTGPLTSALTLSAGLRGDHFDDVGTHATGRIGLLGAVNENTQWRANAGTGFKAPSFFGLAHPLVGNPDLKPERGRSIDAGLRHTFASGRGLVDVSLFASELTDGVDFDPGPPPRVANVAEIRSSGAEAAAIWRWTRTLSLSGALTYTDARSQPDEARMRSRPHWRGSLGVVWSPLPELALDARLTGIDEVPDSSIPTGDVMLPGWARVDLAARWTIRDRWSVTAACDNLLDQAYEEVVGFTAPGRRLRLGLRVNF